MFINNCLPHRSRARKLNVAIKIINANVVSLCKLFVLCVKMLHCEAWKSIFFLFVFQKGQPSFSLPLRPHDAWLKDEAWDKLSRNVIGLHAIDACTLALQSTAPCLQENFLERQMCRRWTSPELAIAAWILMKNETITFSHREVHDMMEKFHRMLTSFSS